MAHIVCKRILAVLNKSLHFAVESCFGFGLIWRFLLQLIERCWTTDSSLRPFPKDILKNLERIDPDDNETMERLVAMVSLFCISSFCILSLKSKVSNPLSSLGLHFLCLISCFLFLLSCVLRLASCVSCGLPYLSTDPSLHPLLDCCFESVSPVSEVRSTAASRLRG